MGGGEGPGVSTRAGSPWDQSAMFQPFCRCPWPELRRGDTIPKHKGLLPLDEGPVSSYIRTEVSTLL